MSSLTLAVARFSASMERRQKYILLSLELSEELTSCTPLLGKVSAMQNAPGCNADKLSAVSDKLTQNELDELEGTLQQSSTSDTSILRNLLDMIPDGMFGGKKPSSRIDEIQSDAAAAQMQSMRVSPREPEEYTRYINRIFKQVMPAIEFHDEVIQSISEAIEKIPVLPKIVEQLEDQMSVFVFSIMAPFVVPVIQQVKNELRTGSDEVIQSSEKEQHIVFYDDNSSDPTHSMLSKDHFSNVSSPTSGGLGTANAESPCRF